MAAAAVEPGDRAYARHSATFWHASSPGVILRPGDADEVAEAVAYAGKQEVPLTVRSGGHGVLGSADGGVVIDLSRLAGIEVLDAATGRVRVGPGARWGHVARELYPHGLAISSGDHGGVGVGGIAVGGGIGLLNRKHGLTIDHLRAARIVLADGSIVRADAEHHPDLFWGIRGAGGNFGIVTEFEFEAQPLTDVVQGSMYFDAGAAADAAGLLERWGQVIEDAPRELTGNLYLFPNRGSFVAHLTSVYAGDDAEATIAALTPLLGIGPVLDQQAIRAPYPAILPGTDDEPHGGPARPLVGSGLAVHMSEDVSALIAEGMGSGAARWLAVRAVGGAVNDVDPAATAYPHRHQNFAVSSIGARRDRFLEHWDALRPSLDGLYLNFETDLRPERLAEAYPGDTMARLRRVKAQYDPENVFSQGFAITPADRA